MLREGEISPGEGKEAQEWLHMLDELEGDDPHEPDEARIRAFAPVTKEYTLHQGPRKQVR
jgi:hypothetical protein